MQFDWSINLGNLLTGVCLLIGLVAAHIQNVRRLEHIETRLDLMYKWFVHSVVNRGGDDVEG